MKNKNKNKNKNFKESNVIDDNKQDNEQNNEQNNDKNSKVLQVLNIVAYVRYFKHKNTIFTKVIPVYENDIKPNDKGGYDWKYRDEKEPKDKEKIRVYNLDDISYYVRGIPLYNIIYPFKNSVPLRLNKENDKLISKFHRPNDVYLKLNSKILDLGLKENTNYNREKLKIFLSLGVFVVLLVIVPFLPFMLM